MSKQEVSRHILVILSIVGIVVSGTLAFANVDGRITANAKSTVTLKELNFIQFKYITDQLSDIQEHQKH